MITKEKEQKIKELRKRLDWYYDCASDEEFDVDEVISLLSQLDEMEPIDSSPWESDAKALADFWVYVSQHEIDEQRLS